MSYNSTIKRKKCKCSPDCKFPPTISFSGYYYSHAPQEIKDKQGEKAKKGYQSKLQRQRESNLSRKIHQVGGSAQKEVSSKFEPRSSFKNDSTIPDKGELLALADKLFSQYIKKRDADSLGNVTCVCCKLTFNIKDKVPDGRSGGDKMMHVVQPLHFVSRAIYSLRWEENQVFCGCCYCNLGMHIEPEGKEYKSYRSFLVDALGEDKVKWMELQKREINKLSAGMLAEVIEKYKTKK